VFRVSGCGLRSLVIALKGMRDKKLPSQTPVTLNDNHKSLTSRSRQYLHPDHTYNMHTFNTFSQLK